MFRLRSAVLSTMATHQVLVFLAVSLAAANARECNARDVTFELHTGFVYSAPGDLLSTHHGVLGLPDCLALCRNATRCYSLNFETGLCVLFAENSEQPGVLTESHFPVITMFAQKRCVRGAGDCGRPWTYELVRDHTLSIHESHMKLRRRVATRHECIELCLYVHDFTCRSAVFHRETGECNLSEMDRFSSQDGGSALIRIDGVDYLESNCAPEPAATCDFTSLYGRILKTVDAVIQNVSDIDTCRRHCLDEQRFRCRSLDYEETGEKVCRLSHHSSGSLSEIHEPYLELTGATTLQLGACYNLSIECRSNDMVARIRTNRLFSGRVYSRSRPHTCAVHVVDTLAFELKLGYQDLGCDVTQEQPGLFSATIVIQHHEQIVTGRDIGITVRCTYELNDRMVELGMEDNALKVNGKTNSETAEETAFVASPTVAMRIADRRGEDIHTAQVGDPLTLRFHMLDEDTPYEIFVRELVALDGVDSSEILLIDSLGCPTDPTIMGPITIVQGEKGKQILQAPFDAFKFPTSDIVQFRALVTPCVPHCESVVCQFQDYNGGTRTGESLGRKKRSINNDIKMENDMMVIQSIRIEDKFESSHRNSSEIELQSYSLTPGINEICFANKNLWIIGICFACLQILIILACYSATRRPVKKHADRWHMLHRGHFF